MGQVLASDVDNKSFVNPVDPDAALSVEFFMDNPQDQWASNEKSVAEGRRCVVKKHKEPQPYVRIMNPGDQTSIIVQPVREDHKRRFTKQWLYFASNEGLIEEQIQGWRIEEWEHLDAEQIRDLKHMRFHTVEQIANASDASVQGMGMMGPGLRIEAKKALQQTLANQIKTNEEEKDKEIAELKKQMSTMQTAIDNMGPKGDEKPAKGK